MDDQRVEKKGPSLLRQTGVGLGIGILAGLLIATAAVVISSVIP